MLLELMQNDTFTFKDQLDKKQLDVMNPKLVQKIGSCILLSEINHPNLVEIVNQ